MIDPWIPQHLIPLATAGHLGILDPEDEGPQQAAMASISQEQARPLSREDGLRGGIWLFAVVQRRTIRDREMDDLIRESARTMLGLCRTRTDVKRGGENGRTAGESLDVVKKKANPGCHVYSTDCEY